ncbi:unnamed protein product [Paramecium primaurelia]|uniref:Peptidylprolyl isomerase n=1 Tax=Paramecium primaurelia TaxID=5886 RepID=A0A8S1NDY8_PARPR|nr:unnamed protein product [Paramecium primaurelia]
MNQSDWFSIEDDQLFQNQEISQQNKTQTEMERIVSKYDKIILQQQNLIKYIVVVSKNEDPQKQINEKSRIKIRCEERDEKGTILNPTQNQNILKICLASSIPLIKGFRLALLSMKEGEKAWFKIQGDLLEKPDNIENFVKDQVKYYLIQVEEVIQPQQQLDVTNVENRVIQLEKFKQEGNKLYQNGDYVGAASRYLRGINFIEKWPKYLNKEKNSEVIKEDFYLVLISNRAQALIKLKDYQECQKILEPIMPRLEQKEYKVKCYYRLVFCLIQMEEYQKAQDYINIIKRDYNYFEYESLFKEFEDTCNQSQ